MANIKSSPFGLSRPLCPTKHIEIEDANHPGCWLVCDLKALEAADYHIAEFRAEQFRVKYVTGEVPLPFPPIMQDDGTMMPAPNWLELGDLILNACSLSVSDIKGDYEVEEWVSWAFVSPSLWAEINRISEQLTLSGPLGKLKRVAAMTALSDLPSGTPSATPLSIIESTPSSGQSTNGLEENQESPSTPSTEAG